MENSTGRLSVQEFLALIKGIREHLIPPKLSPEDQAKLDAAYAKLVENDSAVARALIENDPARKGGT